jgi:hypothetical protein
LRGHTVGALESHAPCALEGRTALLLATFVSLAEFSVLVFLKGKFWDRQRRNQKANFAQDFDRLSYLFLEDHLLGKADFCLNPQRSWYLRTVRVKKRCLRNLSHLGDNLRALCILDALCLEAVLLLLRHSVLEIFPVLNVGVNKGWVLLDEFLEGAADLLGAPFKQVRLHARLVEQAIRPVHLLNLS